ncbi:MAG: hypothetical protein GXP40_00670, partial [Chloroflexi bacterium]|nr:hypothetical protein [Chloroflexota bacterium]
MTHLTELQLNECLDGTLDSTARQRVEAHLSACEACRARLDDLRLVFSALEGLPETPLTRDLTPGVLARLPKARLAPSLWRQPAFLVQSLLTLILLAAGAPMLRAMGRQFAAISSQITLPRVQIQSLPQMIAVLTPLLTWKPALTLTLPAMPQVLRTTPSLPTMPVNPDARTWLILLAAAGILWLVGNL